MLILIILLHVLLFKPPSGIVSSLVHSGWAIKAQMQLILLEFSSQSQRTGFKVQEFEAN